MSAYPPQGPAQQPGAGRISGRASVGGPRGQAGADPWAADPSGYPPPADPGYPPSPGRGGRVTSGKRRPRWGRIALVIGVVLAVLAGGVVIGGYLFVKHIDNKFTHIDAFSTIPGPRPPAGEGENILLLGSDSRQLSAPADLTGWRTDTIILMHVTADGKKAYLISIPRDSWLHIPRSMANPKLGDTNAKINAAFSWGGIPLTVQTVEEFTNVRIDHVVIINFAGFEEVTNALGGVDMYVDQTITSIHKPHRKFTKGNHHFNGAQALDYIRQRYQYANGDLTRVKHQQQFLKAIMDKATSTGTLTNISKMNSFLDALSKAVIVDKDFELGSQAWDLRDLRSSDMTFMTSPTSGFATEPDGESAVVVDKTKAASLYAAVRSDTVGTWLKSNGSS